MERPGSPSSPEDPRRSARAGRSRPTSRIRIVDVASAAGVSQSTASKALNGSPDVGMETRTLVEDTARRLGYRPNVLARTLTGWNSQSIGVVTDDEDGFFSTSMLKGIERCATDRGFGVFLCNSLGDTTLERRHLLSLLDKRVDGIILLGSEVRGREAPAVDLGGTPVVYLYCYSTSERATSVVPDDRAGAEEATRVLIERGHRRIAFLNGPQKYQSARERYDGYCAALSAAGIPVDPALVRSSTTDWYPRVGYQLMHEVLGAGADCDAVFAASDHLASGAMSALLERRVEVPHDVSVVGFDDRPVAAHLPVPLTTMALPQEQMGFTGTQLLLDAVGGGSLEARTWILPPVWVERSSVRPR